MAIEITPRLIVLVIIIIYTRPLWVMRYKFRSAVYDEKSWKINFRPWFWKETKALFTNKYFKKDQLRIAWFYRAYLAGFLALWLLFKFL